MRFVIFAVVIVLLLAGAVVVAATWRFSRSITGDIDRLIASAGGSRTVVTDAMIAGLTPPARRYFTYAGVVGKPIPRVVRLTQQGRIRSSAAANWMDLVAEETYSTEPPAFVWRAWFPQRAVPVVMGRDEYLDGNGSILMKMGGLLSVADERGDELRAAGLMRYLNEMTWFPAAFLGPNVTIAPLNDTSFKVTIANRDMTAEGTLFVDPNGRLTNFRALRFNTATRSMETWETPMTAWGDRAGLRLPTAGKAVWKLKDGDFTYIELTIGDITYD